jgi:hypothetical protein
LRATLYNTYYYHICAHTACYHLRHSVQHTLLSPLCLHCLLTFTLHYYCAPLISTGYAPLVPAGAADGSYTPTLCRGSTDPCDIADYCLPAATTCGDTYQAVGHACNATQGVCQGPKLCVASTAANATTGATMCQANFPADDSNNSTCTDSVAGLTAVTTLCKAPVCSGGACIAVNDNQGGVCQHAVDNSCTPTLTCDAGECGGATHNVCVAQGASGRRFY